MVANNDIFRRLKIEYRIQLSRYENGNYDHLWTACMVTPMEHHEQQENSR